MPEQITLQNKLSNVEQGIIEVREYYTLHLMESLDSESKKLTSLTRILITLTAILAVLTLVLVIRTFIR